MSTIDLHTLRAQLAGTDTATLENRLAATRRTYAGIGHFPDQRRTEDRAYFVLADEVNRRAPSRQTPAGQQVPRLSPTGGPQLRDALPITTGGTVPPGQPSTKKGCHR